MVFSGGTITQDIGAGVVIDQLQMSSGTLVLSNPLTLNAGLQFSGGSITSGTLNIAGVSNQSATMTVSALTINNSGSYNLNFDASNVFSGGAIFSNSGTLTKGTGAGTLTFNNQLNNTGTVSVLSGTLLLTAGGLNAGTLNVSTGATLEFLTSNAFFSGSVFSGAGVVQFDNNTDTTFNGTINNSGNLLINAGGNLTRLVLGGDITLTGGGTLTLGGVNAQITGGFQLTNVNNTIQGQGNIGANLASVLNQTGGTINANLTSAALFVDPGSGGFANQGLMEAINGGLLQLTGNGGGAFNNTGGIILANGTGSEVQLLSNVSITAGTLQTLNGGVIRAVSGQSVFLNGLTIAGTYVVDNNADTHITGTINNLGAINLNAVGNLTRLVLDANSTLTGGGTLNLVGVNAQVTGGFQLTNFDNVIQGQGNLGANLTAIVNQAGGIIDANVSGQVLYVDPVNSPTGFVNNGLLEATNGGFLQLTNNGGGSFVNNATILANGAGSEVQLLQNVDITGGTLSGTGGGIIHALTGQAVFLHNVTLSGPYVNDNNADTHITGTINNLGSISLNAVANLTRLVLESDVTLTGGGTVNLNGVNAQITAGGGFQLTNVNNLIQGQGNLGANVAFILNQAGGVINANVTGQGLLVDPINNPNGFVNQGVFEATNGGLLQLTGNGGGAFVNTGSTILASGSGSEVQLLQNVDITGGTLSATGGGIIHALTGQAVFLHNLTLSGPYVSDNNTDTHITGTINNLGSISVNAVGNITRLVLESDVTLTGGGTVNLNGANAQITTGVGFQLTNVNNLIQGQGNLGANVAFILNQAGGVINANVTGQGLLVDPINNPNGFVNQGVFDATNGG